MQQKMLNMTFLLDAIPSKDDRSPSLLDRIPLYSPLYGGVQREGRVEPLLSLSFPPPVLTSLHRAPYIP